MSWWVSEWAQLGPRMGFPLLNEPSLSVPHHECAWWKSNNQKPAWLKERPF
jgi:hypothetical protein